MSEPNHRVPHVAIACGGTGGHLFPGIAVAQEIRNRGGKTLVLISEKKIDQIASANHPELDFAVLPSHPWPGLSPKILNFALKFWRGRRKCYQLLKNFEVTSVLGMGGFTSLTPLMVGRSLGVSTYLHESNAYPGKANRLAARFCDRVLLGFHDCAENFPNRTVEVTGTPLREALTRPPSRNEAIETFQLDPNRKTLLLVGGSQGAKTLNRVLAQSLSYLADQPIQVIHICGPQDYDEMVKLYENVSVPAHLSPFCHHMEAAYTAADLALARSGASTLTELAWYGIPSILVPYPFAADDHQTKNALIFERARAGMLVQEKDLSAESLAQWVREWIHDPTKLETLSNHARSLAITDAARRIADIVCATKPTLS